MSTIEEFNGTLGIPRSTASRALLEIAANVLDSPVLQKHIKTWVIPGREMELPEAAWDPEFVVPADLCPILLLWPDPRDGQPSTNIRQQATLGVIVRLWVATLDPLDCMDLYGQIEAAVCPDTVANGQALRARLQPITGWSGNLNIGSPGPVRYPSTGGPVMLAEASISTPYNITSY
jgi:hypothetical protein